MLHKSMESTAIRGIPMCTLLVGPSGSGKSTLAKYFLSELPQPYEEEQADGLHKIIPSLYSLVPSPITIKTFARTLLLDISVIGCKGDTVELTRELVRKIQLCKMKVIFFDEIQNLAKPAAVRTRILTLDWIVSLLGMIGIPIILCGTEECLTLLDDHKPFARRYPYVSKLNHLKYEENEYSEFKMTLKGLDERMYSIANLSNGIHLTDKTISLPLYIASRGNLEYLRQILHEALSNALNRGRGKLEHDDFVLACNSLSLPLLKHTKENPFQLSINTCYTTLRAISDENE